MHKRGSTLESGVSNARMQAGWRGSAGTLPSCRRPFDGLGRDTTTQSRVGYVDCFATNRYFQCNSISLLSADNILARDPFQSQQSRDMKILWYPSFLLQWTLRKPVD